MMEWLQKNETKCQLFVAVLLAAVSVMYTDAANPHGVPNIDSGTFLYLGMVIQHGGMPYVDAFDHKGPLIYIMNALAMEMGNWHMIVVFETVALVAAFFLMFRIARLRAGFFSSLLITALCAWLMTRDMLDLGNLTEEYALPWIALAALLFLRFFQTGKICRCTLFLIGFSLSLVIALRPNMIAVWGGRHPRIHLAARTATALASGILLGAGRLYRWHCTILALAGSSGSTCSLLGSVHRL